MPAARSLFHLHLSEVLFLEQLCMNALQTPKTMLLKFPCNLRACFSHEGIFGNWYGARAIRP